MTVSSSMFVAVGAMAFTFSELHKRDVVYFGQGTILRFEDKVVERISSLMSLPDYIEIFKNVGHSFNFFWSRHFTEKKG